MLTKNSLQKMIDDAPRNKQIQIVGRALIVIFKKQTEMEKSSNTTKDHNGIGFTSSDGYSGCLTAKSFIKNKTLRDWQLDKWLKKNKKGYSRIAKYHRQLNLATRIKNNSPLPSIIPKHDEAKKFHHPIEKRKITISVTNWSPT